MFIELVTQLRKLRDEKQKIVIAIDGRCAAGKTTLAKALQEELGCQVIHMDHFFLRPEQRTPERYQEPGGNVDRERFLEEVLLPLQKEEQFSYRPFDCHSMSLAQEITIYPNSITIVEGTYSAHPQLWNYYDYHIFMTVSKGLQLKRIARRNGAYLSMFRDQWIPMEEKYFAAFDFEQKCEFVYSTSDIIFIE